MEIRKSNELQIGKAGEYLVCADLCIKGLIAFPSEQGLPYDVLIDVDGKLLKCQVKTTEKPRIIPQRNKETKAYVFGVKRKGKNNLKRYTYNEVDVFALVALDTMQVGYLINNEMPDTLNIRVESFRGTYHDEQGVKDYETAKELFKTIKNKSEIARIMNKQQAVISRLLQPDYKPFITNAIYFSDLIRGREWFQEI